MHFHTQAINLLPASILKPFRQPFTVKQILDVKQPQTKCLKHPLGKRGSSETLLSLSLLPHSPLPFFEWTTWLAIATAIAGSEKLQLFLIPLPGRIPDARLIAYILIPWSLLTPARSPPGTSAGHGDQSGTKMFPRALSTNQAVRKASAILLGILVTAMATLSPRSNPRAQE